MKYFFETKTTVDELVKETIEEMASILIGSKEIIVVCEMCGLFISTQNLSYKVYYYYPKITVKSNDIKDLNACKRCIEAIKSEHEIIEK